MSYYIVEINEPTSASARAKTVMYVYTKDKVFAFESITTAVSQATTPEPKMQPLVPFMAWTFINEKGERKEINFVNHGFGDIPLIEFPNNAERIGDAEPVFDLISLYNDINNNRGKNLHDIVNYLLYIKNARIGNEEERKDFIRMLEDNHILAVEGDDVDARFLTNQLNQEQLQTLQDSIKDNIHYISRIPDLSSTDFSQNASDPIIKIKTKTFIFMFFTFYGLFEVTSPIHNFCISDISEFSSGKSSINELSWLIVAFWIVAQAVQLALYGFCLAQTIKFTFNINNEVVPILVVVAFMLLWSLLGEKTIRLEEVFYSVPISILNILTSYILPILLWIGYGISKHKQKKKEGVKHEKVKDTV